MADDTQAAVIPGSFQSLYEQFLQRYLEDTPPMQYNGQTRDQLAASYKAGNNQNLQDQILQRKNATQQNNAAIDTDAAARGVGTSTWVTDAKNRNMQAQARDVSGMYGTYNANMNKTLAQQLADQEAKRLGIEQYNRERHGEASSKALAMASGLYGEWGAQPDASPGPYTPPTEPKDVTGLSAALAAKLAGRNKKKNPYDPYDYTRSYAQNPGGSSYGSFGGGVGGSLG